MVGHSFKDIKHSIQLSILIFTHNLEGSKALSGEELEMLFALEVLKGHIESGGLNSAVALRNTIIFKSFPSK